MDDHPHHQSMATPAAASMCGSKSKTKLQGGGERSSRGSGGGNSPPAAMRKGPWTEEEDAQLVWFVRLFGERRWDFLAKVSGLRGGGCIPKHAYIHIHIYVYRCMLGD
jgi:myb proto-oncogene protein